MTGRPGRVRWVIGLLLTVLSGGVLVALVGRTLWVEFGSASGDPHGYLVIFGTVIGVLLLVPLLIGLVLLRSWLRLLRSRDGSHQARYR